MRVEVAVPPPGVRLVRASKPDGVRWLTELDDETATAYAACVVPLVPTVETSLSPAVVANRVAACSTGPPRIHLEAWRMARRRFVRLGAARAAGSRALVMTDVAACYASIGPEVVGSALRALGATPEGVERVREMLRAFATAGVPGLPIGPEPSAVLANAVLAVGDRRLAEGGFRHLRWVDDFLVFVDEPADASRALAALEGALSSVGLELSERKTRVVVDPAGAHAVAPDGLLSGPSTTARLRCDADALPGLTCGDALVPGDRGVGARRRAARGTRRGR